MHHQARGPEGRDAARDCAVRHPAARSRWLRGCRASEQRCPIHRVSCSSRAVTRALTARGPGGLTRLHPKRASGEALAALVAERPCECSGCCSGRPGRRSASARSGSPFGWSEPGDWLPDLVVGWILIACGLVGWSRRPERPGVEGLMAATGFAWLPPTSRRPGWPRRLAERAGALSTPRPADPSRALLPDRAALPRDGSMHCRRDRLRGRSAFRGSGGIRTATFALAGLIVLAAALGYVRAVGRGRRAAPGCPSGHGLPRRLRRHGGGSGGLPDPGGGRCDPARVRARAVCAGDRLLAALVREPWARSRVTDLVVDWARRDRVRLRGALAGALGVPRSRSVTGLATATSTRRAVGSLCRQPDRHAG